MDIEPSAPYASASSFPSPIEFQNKEEPSLSYEKLQQSCEGGTCSSRRSMYPKFPLIVPTSFKDFNLGKDLTSKVFSSPLPYSFSHFSPLTIPTLMELRPLNTYFSQNKIAYQIPKTEAKSTSISTLQCGIDITPLDTNKVSPTSSRINEKIKNLDDMLKSLEHYSMTKRCINDVKEPFMKSSLDLTEHEQLRSSILDTSFSNQSMTTAFGVDKALSRLEFKAQMDKLTGVIEDRWFYGDNTKVGRKCSKTLKTSSSTRNKDCLSSQQYMSTTAKNSSNINNCLLKEILQHIVGLEHSLPKRDKPKQTKRKGYCSRRLSVQRSTRRRMVFFLQRQFKRHITSVHQRLDKTDLAIKSLKRQHTKTLLSSSHPLSTQNEHSIENNLVHLKVDCQTKSLANTQRKLSRIKSKIEEVTKSFTDEERVAKQDIISRNMCRIEDELSILRKESQCMSHTLEKVQKLYNEQNMEIELCWTAINHLCIDHDTFRDQIRNSQEQL